MNEFVPGIVHLWLCHESSPATKINDLRTKNNGKIRGIWIFILTTSKYSSLIISYKFIWWIPFFTTCKKWLIYNTDLYSKSTFVSNVLSKLQYMFQGLSLTNAQRKTYIWSLTKFSSYRIRYQNKVYKRCKKGFMLQVTIDWHIWMLWYH